MTFHIHDTPYDLIPLTVNCRRQSSTSEDEVEALGSSSRLFCNAVLLKGGMDFIEGKKKQRKQTHHDGKWSGVVTPPV